MVTSAPPKVSSKKIVAPVAKVATVAAGKPAAKNKARPAPAALKKAAPGVAVTAKKQAVSKPALAPKAANVASKSAKKDSAVKIEGQRTSKVPAVEKSKKSKLVRDSFTMPETEYAALGEVKKACLKAGFEVKKSELLRIGVALVRKLTSASLKHEVGMLAPLKAGRPRKEKVA